MTARLNLISLWLIWQYPYWNCGNRVTIAIAWNVLSQLRTQMTFPSERKVCNRWTLWFSWNYAGNETWRYYVFVKCRPVSIFFRQFSSTVIIFFFIRNIRFDIFCFDQSKCPYSLVHPSWDIGLSSVFYLECLLKLRTHCDLVNITNLYSCDKFWHDRVNSS